MRRATASTLDDSVKAVRRIVPEPVDLKLPTRNFGAADLRKSLTDIGGDIGTWDTGLKVKIVDNPSKEEIREVSRLANEVTTHFKLVTGRDLNKKEFVKLMDDPASLRKILQVIYKNNDLGEELALDLIQFKKGLNDWAGIKPAFQPSQDFEGLGRSFSKLFNESKASVPPKGSKELDKAASEAVKDLPAPPEVRPENAVAASPAEKATLTRKLMDDSQATSVLALAAKKADMPTLQQVSATRMAASVADARDIAVQFDKSLGILLEEVTRLKVHVSKKTKKEAGDAVIAANKSAKELGGNAGGTADGIADDLNKVLQAPPPPKDLTAPPREQIDAAQNSLKDIKQKSKKFLAELDDEWDKLDPADAVKANRDAQNAVASAQRTIDAQNAVVSPDPGGAHQRSAVTAGEATIETANSGLLISKRIEGQPPDAQFAISQKAAEEAQTKVEAAVANAAENVRKGDPIDERQLDEASKAVVVWTPPQTVTSDLADNGRNIILLGWRKDAERSLQLAKLGDNPDGALQVAEKAGQEVITDLRAVRLTVTTDAGQKAVDGFIGSVEEAQAFFLKARESMPYRLRMETQGQFDDAVQKLIDDAAAAYDEVGGHLAATHTISRAVNIFVDARTFSANINVDPRRIDANDMAREQAKGTAARSEITLRANALASGNGNHTAKGKDLAKNGTDGAQGAAGRAGVNGVDGKPLSNRKRNVIIGLAAVLGVTAAVASIWGIIYAIADDEDGDEKARIEKALRRFFYAAIAGDIPYGDAIYAMEELLSEAEYLGIEMDPIWEDRIDYLRSLMLKIDKNYGKYATGELNMYEDLYGSGSSSSSFWDRNWGWIVLLLFIFLGFILIGVIIYFGMKTPRKSIAAPRPAAPATPNISTIFF